MDILILTCFVKHGQFLPPMSQDSYRLRLAMNPKIHKFTVQTRFNESKSDASDSQNSQNDQKLLE
ncbi:MAG: hypothetical protein ACK5NN_04200 [Sphingomonadaceae bacterium]